MFKMNLNKNWVFLIKFMAKDVLSNEIMINLLRGSGKTAILVSEEDEEVNDTH